MKRLLTYFCLFFTLTSCCKSQVSEDIGIIPMPQHVEAGRGYLSIPDELTFSTNLPEDQKLDLVAWMSEYMYCSRSFVEQSQDAFINFNLEESSEELSGEAYTLQVGGDAVEITAASDAGIFYGLQSLLQMMEVGGDRISRCTIVDSPRFEYRGMMLDVSRHFRDVDFIKRQLDLLARYKVNRFHWHLTDGAGWRIEIKSHPELCDIAAWRPYEVWGDWTKNGCRYSREGEKDAFGGYYTQDDVRDVVEYARLRHITVIPEIEMPGHSEEVLTVYPQLSCSGKPYTDFDYCIGNEETFKFLEDVLTEVIDLFPSKYIHIGGDEANKQSWKSCPKCQKRMKSENLACVDELQSYMIHRIEAFLNSKGRDLLGWDEIIEGGLTPNATVMSWRGLEGGLTAAKAGNRAIMTPSQYCYLDQYQDNPSLEPMAGSSIVALKTLYDYDPRPDTLPEALASKIIGVQANLWVEYVATEEHTEYMLWPRMLALSEVGWSSAERKNYENFFARALNNVEWLKDKGYSPFELSEEFGPRKESLQQHHYLSTGKKLEMNPKYNPKYPGIGDNTLVDGLHGDWSYQSSRWSGWIGTQVEFTVDLDESQPIKRVAIDFLQGKNAYIWLPGTVEFYISEDGETFEKIGQVDQEVDHNLDMLYQRYEWLGESSARYVKLVVINANRAYGWMFADEFVVE